MNDICRNLFPDNPVDYKISFDENLRDVGIEIYNLMESAGLLHDSFPSLEESYRYAYVHTNHHSQMINPEQQYSYIPEEHQNIYDTFKTGIVDYLGIDENCYQLKVEKLVYTSASAGFEDRFSRMSGLWARNNKGNEEPLGDREQFGTGLWHTDVGCNLNNMVFLMYLSDVEQDMGGFCIADPPQKVGFDVNENRPKYLGPGAPCFADTVPYREITGPAGTIVGFNSHTLHRANLPKKGFRKALHMNILSNYPEHKAEGYIPDVHEGVTSQAI